MGKKKFIDKKKSATFHLLARDSSDPNYNVGPSGDRVFVRVDNNSGYYVDGFLEDDNCVPGAANDLSVFADAPDDYDDADSMPGVSLLVPRDAAGPLPDHVRKEILELGFPDDGYNYLIHLREIRNAGGGASYYENPKAKLTQIPHDVKAYDASRLHVNVVGDNEIEKSIYSVAAKTVNVKSNKAIDPDVAALLDDSGLSRFGSDIDDLEEDFVAKANLGEVPAADEELERKLSFAEEFEMDGEKNYELDEPHPHKDLVDISNQREIDNYMDSGDCPYNEMPRIRRPLDEQFDLVERQEYGTDCESEFDEYMLEENYGPESITEKLNHAFTNHPVDFPALDGEYKSPSDCLCDLKNAEDAETKESALKVIRWCRDYADKYDENSNDGTDVLEESSDKSEYLDCETIISTYSNLENHPGIIKEPELRRKKLVENISGVLGSQGHNIHLKDIHVKDMIPIHHLPHREKSKTKVQDSVKSSRTEPQKRKQHGQETKEEKKERKAAVKQDRREARRAKKEMKGVYKGEAQRAYKAAAIASPFGIHIQ